MNVRIDTVMLDMDGVLVDFHKGVYDAFEMPYVYDSRLQTWNFWENWPNKVTRGDIDAKCDALFWSGLDWMHDGKDILKLVLDKFDVSQVYLLTNPIVGGHGSCSGKLEWIDQHMRQFYHRTILTVATKSLLAKPNVLLIDDNDLNIDEFAAAGGQVIQVPRPWNRDSEFAHNTVEAVAGRLEGFINGHAKEASTTV